MRRERLIVLILSAATIFYSCVPLQSISRHSFDSGYYKLKYPGSKPAHVYVHLSDDSLVVHNVTFDSGKKAPDPNPAGKIEISKIKPGSYLYQSTFTRKSPDFDLSTVALKYRPAISGVPNQLSYNVNALLYLGYRKDYYFIKSHPTPLKTNHSHLLQIGFDAGLFAGFGITPLNPTVTDSKIVQEYDGFFFQKGIAAFITIEQMSVGLSLGFDNLLDSNSKNWIYNQKPWIGIIIGIANF